ncbi:type-2 ice-structuring protein-like [Archocentrus centrarchus]|uniref:type-2 ice-structuring protein-like n=1 Tax=Archocentrus centrarchus TaxID=63155 RepID=UPI0011E9E11D|nr:type-2 ice-structuring protein-like [Archocentrus centrarchus]XP_030609438.1 type-2 ice-structuring protein-like [Archocentrus centrarchus]
MKTLTVSLLVCTTIALIQAFFLPDYHHQYPTQKDTPTVQPANTEGMFGGWAPWCPSGWSMHSQQCLLFVPTKMTWEEAKKNCGSRGGQLASVYNDLQAEEIRKETQRSGYNHGQFWVGGHNTPENPSWSWSDYMGVSAFADFCREKHENHCLLIALDEGSRECLDDMKCETKLPSVCGYIIM